MGLDERVLIVPSSEFDALGRFQGFLPEADRYLDHLLAPGLGSFRERRKVEDDPNWQQIIPYVVFRSGIQVFTYARGKSGTEARLRTLRSLGVGGHVAEADADGVASRAAYEVALHRELHEEVALGSPGLLTTVGLINDDSNPVGRVHLGVVHLYELNRPEVSSREDALADPCFLTVDELIARRDEFETWSQIVIDVVLAGTASMNLTCSHRAATAFPTACGKSNGIKRGSGNVLS